jgi:autotransporter-associated beta strand protein
MKKHLTSSRSFILRHGIKLCSALLLTLGASKAHAGLDYWDPQGTTGATPYLGNMSGSWEGTLWGTSSGGVATPVAWTEGNAADFAVHATNTNPFTVTLGANHTVAGFFIGTIVTTAPAVTTLNGPGIITMGPANLNGFSLSSTSVLTIDNVIAGIPTAGLCAEGSGQVYLNGTNTYTGNTYLGYSGASFGSGIWYFTNTDSSQPTICTSFGVSNIVLANCVGGALVAEGSAAFTVTNPVTVYQEAAATMNIVGNMAGITFSGPWKLSGGTPGEGAAPYATNNVVLPSYGQVSIGSGGAANNLVTISGIISGTNNFSKYGVGILELSATNTYSGNTAISNGTFGLTATGSISNSPLITIETNCTFDVSGLTSGTFNLSSGTALFAYGTTNITQTTPPTINGPATGTVNLGSQPITLVLSPGTGGFSGETTNVCLNVAQGALTLNNNTLVVSNATSTPLGAGTYTLITVASGTINGSPNPLVNVQGGGIAAGTAASLLVSGSTISLVITPATATTTTTLTPTTAITYGQSTSYIATVSPVPDGGEVQFYVNGALYGSPVAVNTTDGTATSAATSPKLAVGSYTVTATYDGSPDGASGASSATAVTQVINKATVTVTANANASTTYGTLFNTTTSTAFTTSGLQNSETFGSVTMTVTATPPYSTNTPVGSYTITPSAATGGSGTEADYTITYATGTLTVNAKALTVAPRAISKSYGTATTLGTTNFVVTGLVNGVLQGQFTATLSSAGTPATATVAGSPYPISLSSLATSNTNFNTANYTITYGTSNITVSALAVRLTGLQAYSGLPWVKSSSLTVSNAVNGDPVDVVLGLGFLATANPGIAAISSPATLALGNAGDQGTGLGTGPTAQFNTPSGITVDTNNNIYVADTANNRVVEISSAGVETLVPFTGLVDPAAVAVDTNLNVYVSLPSLNEVIELSAGGTQTTLPITGLNYPVGLAVDQSGDVFVADTLNSQVVEFGTNGVQTTLPFSGTTGLYLPSGITVDTNGDVYVANAGSNNIVELSATGVQSILPFTGLNYATSVAVDTSSNVYVANYGGANTKELSNAGVVSTPAFTGLTDPAGITVDSLGNLYVSDSAHNRIAEFSGSASSSFAGTPGVPNYTLTGAGGTVTNLGSFVFSGLNSATATYGTSITLTGTLSSSGTNLPPSGTVVTVTINGTAKTTTSGALGAFTINYPATNAPVSGSPFTVTYAVSSTSTNIGATNTTTTLTVNPLPVILTGTNTYNGIAAAPADILVVSNVVGTDVVNLASGSATLAAADAGEEAITSVGTLALGGASAANYTLVGGTGAVDVVPEPLSITASNDSKIYGQSYAGNPTAFSSIGLVNNDTIGSVTITTPNGGSATTDPVGTYALQPSAATGGTFNPADYAITYIPGTLTVNPLTVVLAGTKPYDGTTAAPAAILTVANIVGSDSVTVASGTGVLASPATGPEAITSVNTLALGGASVANYTLAGAGGTVTVTSGTLDITPTPQTKTYGQALTLGSGSTNFTATGLQNGETVGSVTITASNSGDAASAQVSGSPYTLTASAATGGTFNPADYTIVYLPGTLTVTPASLTVIATNISRVFGTTNPVFTVTYTNFVNGDTLATSDVAGEPVVYSLATNFSPIGTYDITNTIGTLTSTNYSFVLVDGTLTITNAISTNALVSSENPALPGDAVTFTDTLSTLAPSMAVPRGEVQFQIDSVPFGSPIELTNGIASITNGALTHGYHTIEADYAGTTNVVGSTNILIELINTAPVAGTATYSRQPDVQLTIPIASLLTNATDADGDTLTLIAVSATSTNGAAVTTNSTSVIYTQAAINPNVTDSFTYTVADIYGATNTGTVIVTIGTNSVPVSGNGAGSTVLPNGNVEIGFTGTPGYTYYIEATTNLTSPIIWTIVSTNVADSNGNISFIDTTATNNIGRYFRTTTP